MKKFILSLALIAVLVGCSADEQATYQDDLAYVGFVSSAVDLKVPVNSTGSVDLVLRASNKSSVARTYNVAVIAAQTDANSATYSFPATFTIPADSYTGTLTVTGTDNNLLNASIKKLTLKISGFGANESFDNDKVVINIVEVCPLTNASLYNGNYRVTVDQWQDYALGATVPVLYDSANGLNTFRILSTTNTSIINRGVPYMIVTINPATATVVSITSNTIYNYGPSGTATVTAGSGTVNPCTGDMNLRVTWGTNGTFNFNLVKL